MPSSLATLIAVASIILPLSGQASQGVLEINQTCALNDGCFPGDTAGFPVTINLAGSYRLTGNLAVVEDLDAIVINVSNVTLDLGGFEIAGPGVCSGSGPTINCGAEGLGSGIWVDNNPDFITIRNGVIRNFRLTGIRAEGNGHLFEELKFRHNYAYGLVADERMIIKNCTAIQNGAAGFRLLDGSIIQNSVAMGNGEIGFQLVNAGGTIYGSVAQGNGSEGFWLDELSRFGANNVSNDNGSPDLCGGGECTTLRRYLLTQNVVPSNQTSTSCPAGFEFASTHQLAGYASMEYDNVIGFNEFTDQGGGPPGAGIGIPTGLFPNGWIRSGTWGNAEDNDTAGNCQDWTAITPDDFGMNMVLNVDEDSSGFNENIDFFRYFTLRCDVPQRMWCIESRK